MPQYTPRAGSAKKVYIAHRRWGTPEGTPVSIGSGGEGVQFVDNPDLASEHVVVHVGGHPVDRASAIKLTKAALKEQKREESGKKRRGIVDQIVDEMSAPSKPKADRRGRRGFAWGKWAIVGCIGWVALVIAAGAPLALIATPIMGPLLGWVGAGFLAIVFSEAGRNY